MHNKSIAGLDIFINKCDELIASKFLMAESKISELLYSIVSSQVLYDLINTATDGFNYLEFKKVCLIAHLDSAQKGAVFLPESAKDKIAFVFCLLMEIENKTIELSKFLQTYLYTDGSYFESFYEFGERIIKPFKSTVKAAAQEIYGDENLKNSYLEEFKTEKYQAAKGALNAAKEAVFLINTASNDEKVKLCEYFDALLNAAQVFDKTAFKQLMTGFKYIAIKFDTLKPYYDVLKDSI